MTDDETLRLIIKVGFFAALGAFYPQIMRLWRRLGYRNETEVDTTSWKRGAAIVGGVFGALVVLMLIGSLF